MSANSHSSSKIKDVFIELHDYDFYHNPEEDTAISKRFIARDKILKRLKNLLTLSESKSGAYLVTGYRGMGKTSVVNQAIAGIRQRFSGIPSSARFLRLYMLLVICNFIIGKFIYPLLHNETTTVGFSIFIPLFILLILLLAVCDYIKELPEKENEKGKLHYIKYLFKFTERSDKHTNIKIITQDAFIVFSVVCVACIVSLPYYLYNKNIVFDSNSHPYSFYNTIFFFYLLIVSISDSIYTHLRTYEQKLHDSSDKDKFKHKLKHLRIIVGCMIIGYCFAIPMIFYNSYLFLLFFVVILLLCRWMYLSLRNINRTERAKRPFSIQGLIHIFKQQVNYGNLLPIKINLGQDNLKEIDVLALVAKNTYQTYRQWIDFSGNNLLKRFRGLLVYYTPIIILVHFIYYSSPNQIIHSQWVSKYYITYFPSQALHVDNIKNGTIKKDLANFLLDSSIIKNDMLYVNKINTHLPPNKKITCDYDSNIVSIELRELLQTNNISSDSLLLLLSEPSIINKELQLHIDTIKDVKVRTSARLIFDKYKKSQELSIIWHCCIAVDMFIQTSYYRFIKFFFDKTLINTDRTYLTLPYFLDYTFLLLIISFILVINYLSRFSHIFGFSSRYYILNLLKELIDNIDAQVVTENAAQLPNMMPDAKISLFSFRRQKTYPKLDAKGIEAKLIFIMDEIDRLPIFSATTPRFVFIFDELDKIEPNSNSSIIAKEKEDAQNVRVEDSRARQEVVIKLLGNLKHFLNTAKCKFIFIAGREMYDASLADASDREAYLSSIFNDVIEVPSFYSDGSDGRLSNINSLTELYICRYLIPKPYRHEYKCSLQGYAKFLIDKNVLSENSPELDKTLLLLQNFIVYLSYRSNGAPKKIALQLEKFVDSPGEHELSDKDNLVVRKTNSTIYLKFDTYAQYRIGFTAYLFTPFLMSIGTNLYDSGDKILVSTSFLLDHLYKYHPFAFSWRNLEITPEIIAINKAPQLREFMTGIMNFLTQNHIREISTGLHDFKFNQKLASEIKYVSKISEVESAVFNFTLDESLQLKRFYRKQLSDLKKEYIGRDIKNIQYVHSVSFLHMILGDLYFYDKEYDDAIMQYLDAIQLIRNFESRTISVGNLVLLTRNILKLGLTFERKKSYESALTYYSQISSILTEARSIMLESHHLQEFTLKIADIPYFVSEFADSFEYNKYFKKTLYDGIKDENSKIYKSAKEIWKKFHKKEPSEQDITQIDRVFGVLAKWFSEDDTIIIRSETMVIGKQVTPSQKQITTIKRDELKKHENVEGKKPMVTGSDKKLSEEKLSETSTSGIKNMKNLIGFTVDFFDTLIHGMRFNPAVQQTFFKTTLQEELRLLYQPLIAKLQILEKEGMQGITSIDLERADKEFEFLILPFAKEQKFFIEAEYSNKIGDLLFLKNGYLEESVLLTKNADEETIKKAREEKENLYEYNFIDAYNTANTERLFKPISAYARYVKGCIILLYRGFQLENFKKYTTLTAHNLLPKGLDIEAELIQSIFKIWQEIDSKGKDKTNTNYSYKYADNLINALAFGVIDIADCLLSFAGNPNHNKEENSIDKDRLESILSCTSVSDAKEFSTVEQAIFFYYIASQLLKTIGNFQSANAQRLKILYLLHDSCRYMEANKTPIKAIISTNEDNIIVKKLVERPIRYSYRAYSSANRPEMTRMRNVLSKPAEYDENDTPPIPFIYQNSVVNVDAKEFILYYELLKIIVTDETNITGKYRENIKTNLVSPYNTISRNYIRLLELNLMVNVNYKFYISQLKEKKKPLNDITSEKLSERKKEIEEKIPEILPKIEDIKKKIAEISAQIEEIEIQIAEISVQIEEIEKKNPNTYLLLYSFYVIKIELYKLKKEKKDKSSTQLTEEKDKKNCKLKSSEANRQKKEEELNALNIKAKDIDVINQLEELAIDSLYCLFTILKIHDIYGVNYISTFSSVVASVHQKLPEWIEVYFWVKNKKEESERIVMDNRLQKLLGYNDLDFMNIRYHKEKAIEYYDLAISTHTQGKGKMQLTSKLYYLDDDLNDDDLHFKLALERFRINTGKIHEELIKNIREVVTDGTLYQYKSYFSRHFPHSF